MSGFSDREVVFADRIEKSLIEMRNSPEKKEKLTIEHSFP